MSDLPAVALSEPGSRRGPSLRSGIGALVILAALAAAGLTVYDRRDDLDRGLHQMPVIALVVAAASALASVVTTLFLWHSILRSLGADLEVKDSARVYFVGQLGKYLPGSVWPVLAQMELARRNNIRRRTMLTGSVLAVVLNLSVGAVIACVLLPFVSAEATRRFWWLLLCAPVLVAALHPTVVRRVLNRGLRLIRREPVTEFITLRAELKAAALGAASWLLLGIHIYALVVGVGVTGPRAFASAVTAACVAVAVGILLVPVPAGAGVREVAFVLVLSPVIGSTSALLVALLSRMTLIVIDVALAGAGALSGRRHPAQARDRTT